MYVDIGPFGHKYGLVPNGPREGAGRPGHMRHARSPSYRKRAVKAGCALAASESRESRSVVLVRSDACFSSWVSHKPGLSEQIKRLHGMAMNFLACDREQAFLMPPDPRDWLPEGHLAWFLLASVEQMDLSAFYDSYRVDGWGAGGVRAVDDGVVVALRQCEG